MSRLTYEQLLLYNLEENIIENTREYIPKEKAYELLKKFTRQDFGYDVKAWRAWMRAEKKAGRDPLRRLGLDNLDTPEG